MQDAGAGFGSASDFQGGRPGPDPRTPLSNINELLPTVVWRAETFTIATDD